MIAFWIALGWFAASLIFAFGYMIGGLMAVHRIEEAEARRDNDELDRLWKMVKTIAPRDDDDLENIWKLT